MKNWIFKNHNIFLLIRRFYNNHFSIVKVDVNLEICKNKPKHVAICSTIFAVYSL